MKANQSPWVYQRSEPGLWTVGFFDPAGEWHADSDHPSSEAAAQQTAWLNGSGLAERVAKLESEVAKLRAVASSAANVASCLANGIQPD